MANFFSKLLGINHDQIRVRARKVIISGNILDSGGRSIDVEADEVHLIGNVKDSTNPPWYQRPIGIVTLTVFAGLILALVLALLAS